MRRVPNVVLQDPGATPPTSRELRARVIRAREAAAHRLRDTLWQVNGEVSGTWLRELGLRPPRTDTAVLDQALTRGFITMRGYDRTLRVAWTIADLAGRERPGRREISQALVLRGGELS